MNRNNKDDGFPFSKAKAGRSGSSDDSRQEEAGALATHSNAGGHLGRITGSAPGPILPRQEADPKSPTPGDFTALEWAGLISVFAVLIIFVGFPAAVYWWVSDELRKKFEKSDRDTCSDLSLIHI